MTCLETASVSAYDFVTDHSTQFVIQTSGSVSGTCHVTTSRTTQASISSTNSVEAGVLFAKADASVSGSLERSVTSTAGTSTTFTVPAKTTRTCKYGSSPSKVTGTVKEYSCSSQGRKRSSSGTWQVIGPKRLTWIIS